MGDLSRSQNICVINKTYTRSTEVRGAAIINNVYTVMKKKVVMEKRVLLSALLKRKRRMREAKKIRSY
jgi:hypothetical protein